MHTVDPDPTPACRLSYLVSRAVSRAVPLMTLPVAEPPEQAPMAMSTLMQYTTVPDSPHVEGHPSDPHSALRFSTTLAATPTTLAATPTTLGATPSTLGANPISLGATLTTGGLLPPPLPP